MAEQTLELRLAAMGSALVFPRVEALADDVLRAIDDGPANIGRPRSAPTWRRPLLVAAAVVVALALSVAAIPPARQAVARWLGFDGYRIEPVVDLPDISAVPQAALVPGPGELIARTTVDGREVVVMSLPGDLEPGMFTKIVGVRTTITHTSVGGAPAYWIAGEDHLLFYVDDDGDIVEARFAANTLAWQRGDRVLRVEGDVTLEQALEVASREW